MPTRTSALRGERRKCRSIISNSFIGDAQSRRIAPGDCIAPPGAASVRVVSPADLVAANARRELVEHAVHELVAVGAAIALRELDGLVDDDAIRDVQLMHHL